MTKQIPRLPRSGGAPHKEETMADIAHTKTDQKLEEMEKRLSAIYSNERRFNFEVRRGL